MLEEGATTAVSSTTLGVSGGDFEARQNRAMELLQVKMQERHMRAERETRDLWAKQLEKYNEHKVAADKELEIYKSEVQARLTGLERLSQQTNMAMDQMDQHFQQRLQAGLEHTQALFLNKLEENNVERRREQEQHHRDIERLTQQVAELQQNTQKEMAKIHESMMEPLFIITMGTVKMAHFVFLA